MYTSVKFPHGIATIHVSLHGAAPTFEGLDSGQTLAKGTRPRGRYFLWADEGGGFLIIAYIVDRVTDSAFRHYIISLFYVYTLF